MSLDLNEMVHDCAKRVIEEFRYEGKTLAEWVVECKTHRWISVEERLPERWRMDDKDRTLINYLVYSPDYGVDLGNWVKNAKMWVCMGIPAKVTHWMPLPEPPEE